MRQSRPKITPTKRYTLCSVRSITLLLLCGKRRATRRDEARQGEPNPKRKPNLLFRQSLLLLAESDAVHAAPDRLSSAEGRVNTSAPKQNAKEASKCPKVTGTEHHGIGRSQKATRHRRFISPGGFEGHLSQFGVTRKLTLYSLTYHGMGMGRGASAGKTCRVQGAVFLANPTSEVRPL